MAEAKKSTRSRKGEEKRVDVEHYVPADMNVLYADNLSLVFAEGTFFLTFFQVEPPVIFKHEDADKVEMVKSRAITRLAVKPQDMVRMAEAFDRIVKNHASAWEGDEG